MVEEEEARVSLFVLWWKKNFTVRSIVAEDCSFHVEEEERRRRRNEIERDEKERRKRRMRLRETRELRREAANCLLRRMIYLGF